MITGKNEVTLEFHQSEDTPQSLVEMRFHLPSTQGEGEEDAAKVCFISPCSPPPPLPSSPPLLSLSLEVLCSTVSHIFLFLSICLSPPVQHCDASTCTCIPSPSLPLSFPLSLPYPLRPFPSPFLSPSLTLSHPLSLPYPLPLRPFPSPFLSHSIRQVFADKCLAEADVMQAIGDAIMSFSEIQTLTPRYAHVMCVWV